MGNWKFNLFLLSIWLFEQTILFFSLQLDLHNFVLRWELFKEASIFQTIVSSWIDSFISNLWNPENSLKRVLPTLLLRVVLDQFQVHFMLLNSFFGYQDEFWWIFYWNLVNKLWTFLPFLELFKWSFTLKWMYCSYMREIPLSWSGNNGSGSLISSLFLLPKSSIDVFFRLFYYGIYWLKLFFDDH